MTRSEWESLFINAAVAICSGLAAWCIGIDQSNMKQALKNDCAYFGEGTEESFDGVKLFYCKDTEWLVAVHPNAAVQVTVAED